MNPSFFYVHLPFSFPPSPFSCLLAPLLFHGSTFATGSSPGSRTPGREGGEARAGGQGEGKGGKGAQEGYQLWFAGGYLYPRCHFKVSPPSCRVPSGLGLDCCNTPNLSFSTNDQKCGFSKTFLCTLLIFDFLGILFEISS